MLGNKSQVLSGGECVQAQDVNLVAGLDLVVVLRVSESESKHTLLLQVRLVDTSKRPGDNGKTTKVAGLKGSVLAR